MWTFDEPVRLYYHYWRVDNKVRLNFNDEHIIVKNVVFKTITRTHYQDDQSPALVVEGFCTRIVYDEETDEAVVSADYPCL